MPMMPPRLNTPLALEAQREAPDGTGGLSRSWEPVGHIWAEMRSASGREQVAGLGTQSVVTWRILVRSAPAGNQRRPCAGQRFRLGQGPASRSFAILSVAEADPSGRYLACIATEEAP